MDHTRETRASASEIKFVIDPALGPSIGDWARAHLTADPHGTGAFGDEYETSSLYFDTAGLDVFHRRGSYARAKYRVRRYGQSDMVFLERKLRKPDLLIKRRTMDTMRALELLHKPAVESGCPGEWFHRRLLLRRLRPVCRVSYHRMARVVMCPEGLARLTLDSSLRTAHVDSARFAEDPGIEFLGGQMVLELKYRVYLPALFRQLVEEFALVTTIASKYRLSMVALGHLPVSRERLILPGAGVSYA
jgi:hypothetical protein